LLPATLLSPSRDAAQVLLTDGLKEDLPRLPLLWADGAYTNGFRHWAKE
jgi:hypothetical protein